MPKANPVAQRQTAVKTNRPPQPVSEPMPGAEWALASTGANARSLSGIFGAPGQTGRPRGSQLSLIQRQRLAGQIGRALGNQHLQRFIVPVANGENSLNTTWDDAGNQPGYASEGVCPVCGRRGEGRCPGCGREFVHGELRRSGMKLDEQQHGFIQRDEDEQQEAADQVADEIYEALDGWNDELRAQRALSGHDQAMMSQIQASFQRNHHQSLESYLREQLDGDWLVRAFALLKSTNFHEPHTAVALALIPMGTRDDEFLRILEQSSLAGRQELQRRYDEAFSEIGEGSLIADLKDDLSGAELEKSLALLNRDLTEADKLYLDSLAILGTHTDSVVNRIQAEWAKGPASFRAFEQDWNQYVRNESAWTDTAWTTMTLYEAMDDELSGEEWDLVKAVLDGAHSYTTQAEGSSAESADPLFAAEEVELDVANNSLTAATTGGFTGAGTNEAQVFQAVAIIRRIWQQRIARATLAGDEAKLNDYRTKWEVAQAALMSTASSDMDEDSPDYRRVQLLTAGNLTEADEVYLAGEAYDYDSVVSLVTRYWAQGKIEQLLSQAREPRTGANGEQLRPSFDVQMTIPATRGIIAARMYSMTNRDVDNPIRGANRLKLELDEGDSDSDLQMGYALLTTPGISGELRAATIARFAGEHLRNTEGDTPEVKFLNYITGRYENSTTCWQFQDLLAPSTDPSELVRRAEGRQAASESGILDAVLNDYIRDYDALTGEDTLQVTAESLARLKYIAQQAKANPNELAAMMAMTGADNVEQLAGMEYTAFRARLDEVRALKQAIAEAIATAVELAIEAALTVATGGAAAGALLASLSAALAGMLVREALLGQQYDLISQRNAEQLALTLAGHGFGALGRGAFADVADPEMLRRLGRAGSFLEGAATTAVQQVGVQTLAAGFEGRMPTTESIFYGALSIAGSSLGAGTKGAMTHNLEGATPAILRLRAGVAAEVTQNLIDGVTQEGVALAQSGAGDLTGVDIALRFGRRSADAIGRGTLSGVSGFMAAEVAAERRERQERQAEEAAPEVLDDMAHDPSRMAGDAAEASSNRPGAVAVAKVNDEHTVSLVRTNDGRVVVILCSPVCAQLTTLLQEARSRLGDAGLQVHVDAATAIEARLAADPHDHEALSDLDELADNLRSLLDQVNNDALFGASHADASAQGARTLDDVIGAGRFEDHPELRELYDAYSARKRAANETPMPQGEWVKSTRGRARQLLDQLLPAGWARNQTSRERGEVYVEINAELLGRLSPYPHQEYVGEFPLTDGERIALGPSLGRGSYGAGEGGPEIWRAFITERLPHLSPNVREEFELAAASGNARDLGEGKYWPVDAQGRPWDLHHIVPLEWGGHDIPSNWIPLHPNIHRELHDWWRNLKTMVSRENRDALRSGEQAEYHPELE